MKRLWTKFFYIYFPFVVLGMFIAMVFIRPFSAIGLYGLVYGYPAIILVWILYWGRDAYKRSSTYYLLIVLFLLSEFLTLGTKFLERGLMLNEEQSDRLSDYRTYVFCIVFLFLAVYQYIARRKFGKKEETTV